MQVNMMKLLNLLFDSYGTVRLKVIETVEQRLESGKDYQNKTQK